MIVTKEYLKEHKEIRKYYILIDGYNDDKIARFTAKTDVKKIARKYDNECDGEWEPLLVLYNRDTKKGVYIDDWRY